MATIDQAERDRIVDNIMRRTERWARKNGYGAEALPVDDGLSENARAVQRVLDEEDFGCYQAKMTRLIGTLIGEPLRVKKSSDACGAEMAFNMGVAVVPAAEHAHHNYELGAAAICDTPRARYFLSERYCKWSSEANHLRILPSQARPATRDEVAALVDHLIERGDQRVVEFLTEEL